MEQSHTSAEPLAQISVPALIRALDQQGPASSPEAEDNRKRAAAEITMIFELKESRAFRWYEKEFVDKLYRAAFEALRSPHTKADDLSALRTTYLALRGVKAGLIEREIAHREQISPGDPEISVLREQLAAL